MAKEITDMNALTRWDPFQEMHEMQNRLASFFGRTPMRRDRHPLGGRHLNSPAFSGSKP
jgi:hypothetical protein